MHKVSYSATAMPVASRQDRQDKPEQNHRRRLWHPLQQDVAVRLVVHHRVVCGIKAPLTVRLANVPNIRFPTNAWSPSNSKSVAEIWQDKAVQVNLEVVVGNVYRVRQLDFRHTEGIGIKTILSTDLARQTLRLEIKGLRVALEPLMRTVADPPA